MVAAMTNHSPQRVRSARTSPSVSAVFNAAVNATTSCTIDSFERSIRCVRAISSNQSSGPSKPATASTGTALSGGRRGGASQWSGTASATNASGSDMSPSCQLVARFDLETQRRPACSDCASAHRASSRRIRS